MAAAAFSTSALSIVGASIIDDLSITREQLGFLATVNIVLAALLSPRAGRIVDRIGGRRGLIATFLFGGLAFAVTGLAVAYWILVAAAVVAAMSQAAGNPATNKLISRHIEEGRRGVITGVKQSGGQAASFIGGLLLPIGAETIGWRPTLLIAAGVTLALVVPARSVVPDDRPAGITVVWGSKDLPRSVPWLAAYGALAGVGDSATFFVPFFAAEAVGYGARVAGLAAAIIGLVAVIGRIAWARFAERDGRYILTLGVIALLSVLAGLAFLGSTTSNAFLWVAVVLVAIGSGSWNSVGMLAVMHHAGPERAGRASGRVMFGYLVGLGVAPPLYGRTIDVTGSYVTMWWIAIGAYVAAAVLVLAWARSVATDRERDVASQP